MEAWSFKIDGVEGCLFWISPGLLGEFLGPVVPPLFAQFRSNARDRAVLQGRDPSTTTLAWVPTDSGAGGKCLSRLRHLGSLPEIEHWSDCARWAEAAAERAELAALVDAAPATPRMRL